MMDQKKRLLTQLRKLKSTQRHLNGAQQALLIRLTGKDNGCICDACPLCLELVPSGTPTHSCGTRTIRLMVRESASTSIVLPYTLA